MADYIWNRVTWETVTKEQITAMLKKQGFWNSDGEIDDKKKAFLDQKSGNDDTSPCPVESLVKAQNDSVLQYFLELGAKPTQNALETALQSEQTRASALLVWAGADIYTANATGSQTTDDRTAKRRKADVWRYIDNSRNTINLKNKIGPGAQYAIESAMSSKINLNRVKELLEHGATFWHCITDWDRIDPKEIEKKINTLGLNDEEKKRLIWNNTAEHSPILHAIWMDNSDVVDYLLKPEHINTKSNYEAELKEALTRGDLDLAKKLVTKAGANIYVDSDNPTFRETKEQLLKDFAEKTQITDTAACQLAIDRNDYKMVEWFIHYGVPVTKDQKDKPPLFVQVPIGLMDLVYRRGADRKNINFSGAYTENGKTKSYLEYVLDDDKKVRFFIEHGCKVNEVQVDKNIHPNCKKIWDVLEEKYQNPNISNEQKNAYKRVAKLLLTAGAKDKNSKGPEEMLNTAIQGQDWNRCEMLLELGVNPNASPKGQDKPLKNLFKDVSAPSPEMLDFAKKLISAGADVKGDQSQLLEQLDTIILNKPQLTPSCNEVKRLMYQNGAEIEYEGKKMSVENALRQAIDNNNLQDVKRFAPLVKNLNDRMSLQDGEDPKKWESFLLYAIRTAKNGKRSSEDTLAIVKALESAGADFNKSRDYARHTPLMAAIICDDPKQHKVFDYIMNINSDGNVTLPHPEPMKFGISDRSSDGRQYMHYAAMATHDTDCYYAKKLAQLGAMEMGLNIRDTDINGRPNSLPLHIAAEKGNTAFAKWALENGSLWNESNKSGQTPLQIANDRKGVSDGVATAIIKHEQEVIDKRKSKDLSYRLKKYATRAYNAVQEPTVNLSKEMSDILQRYGVQVCDTIKCGAKSLGKKAIQAVKSLFTSTHNQTYDQ